MHLNNGDASSLYTVSEAVAFGDSLSDEARVQAAHVGIRLTPRKLEPDVSASAVIVLCGAAKSIQRR